MEIDKTNYEGGFDILASGIDTILNVFSPVAPLSGINSIRKFIEQKRTDKTINNIKAFLKEVNKATQEQKDNFKKQMDDNYQNFQDHLLIALEQLDREEKASILGKLQLAVFEGKLNEIEFLKFAKVLELIYIYTLKFFISKDSSSFSTEAQSGVEIQYYHELMGLGLISTEHELTEPIRPQLGRKGEKDKVVQKYKVNPIGNLLLDILIYNVRRAGYSEREARRQHFNK